MAILSKLFKISYSFVGNKRFYLPVIVAAIIYFMYFVYSWLNYKNIPINKKDLRISKILNGDTYYFPKIRSQLVLLAEFDEKGDR